MACNYTSNNIDFVQPHSISYFQKLCCKKSHRQSLNHYLPLSLSLSMVLFESFGDIAERLTARACTFLIGAHGLHFIGRYYPWKG